MERDTPVLAKALMTDSSMSKIFTLVIDREDTSFAATEGEGMLDARRP